MARSIVTIDDLDNEDIEAIFGLADRFLADMATRDKPHRIRGRLDLGRDRILATLFFEPSTRTRLSFESAMLRLGGQILSSADGNVTSFAKGESIADTVRVVENYADAIVLRHPWEGAARVAADYCDVPVINAGDGSHEHPTQTLCDLYTLRVGQRRKTKEPHVRNLRGMTVVLCGDLKHGRTVHSLVYALARFGATIVPLPASRELDFPDHVRRRLAREYNCFPLSKKVLPEDSIPADVLYITPEQPHELSLWEPDEFELSVKLIGERDRQTLKRIKGVDAFYATRLQVERKGAGDPVADYPVINSEFLSKKAYRHSRVMHPLPRVDELGYDIDSDARGVYFKQAAYGVPVRMALIAALLELEPVLSRKRRAREPRYPSYSRDPGLACGNERCVSVQVSERRYLPRKFWIVDDKKPMLRCAYCDHEQQPEAVGAEARKAFTTIPGGWWSIGMDQLVFFSTAAEAEAAGYRRVAPSELYAAGTPAASAP